MKFIFKKFGLAFLALTVSVMFTACGGGGGGTTTKPANSVPFANAGTLQNVATGTLVTLDGSASSDADSDTLSYAWSFTTKPAGSSAALSNAAVVNPTFTADVDGAYVLSLTVNDGKADSTPASVTITAATGNSAPVANAGIDQNVVAGTVVKLNGSASSDADGDTLTYKWSFTFIPVGTVALSDPSIVNPTINADVVGTYTLSLVVNDGTVDSAPDSVTITVTKANSAPVANAGADQNIATGATVKLDGSASSDGDGDTLSYAWSFTSKPTGSSAALSSATVVNPSFTADVDGAYVLSLVVNDGAVNSTADSITINATTANSAPVANAGVDQNVATGVKVTLDGSASSDANSDTLSYKWAFTSVPTGSGVTNTSLSSTITVNPSFTPDTDGAYVLSLVVNDGKVDSAPDSITVTAATVNSVPVANAGADQSVSTGKVVTLDGSASSDADGDTLSYTWSFTSVPTGSGVTNASLSDATAVSPTFTADIDGAYVLSLVVNDGKANSTADLITMTSTTAVPTMVSISVNPAKALIAMHPDFIYGKTKQFVATGHYDDGSSKEITATWSIIKPPVNPAQATIDSATGLATFYYRLGTLIVRAVSGKFTADAAITVRDVDEVKLTHRQSTETSSLLEEYLEGIGIFEVVVSLTTRQTRQEGPYTELYMNDTNSTQPALLRVHFMGTTAGTYDVSTFIPGLKPAQYKAEDALFTPRNWQHQSPAAASTLTVKSLGAPGEMASGSYRLNLCDTTRLNLGECGTDYRVIAGTFYAEVEPNIGSLANPETQKPQPIPWGTRGYGLHSSFGSNYTLIPFLTPGQVYGVKLENPGDWDPATTNIDLALVDSSGKAIPCDVVSNIGNGVGQAEECQFTATGTEALAKVTYVSGPTQQSYDLVVNSL